MTPDQVRAQDRQQYLALRREAERKSNQPKPPTPDPWAAHWQQVRRERYGA